MRIPRASFLAVLLLSANLPFARAQHTAAHQGPATTVAVAPQYDTTHVYVSPENLDPFVKSFLGTFGGTSTQPAITTVTPTPSSTVFQALKTPSGSISLFAFKTPIPAHFGSERTGYLVQDMDAAIRAARAAGADVIVAPFPDPIGKDAIIQWLGGINMQLYWHTTPPVYAPLQYVPENRVYLSPDCTAAFLRGFLAFSNGKIVSDEVHAPGLEIGSPGANFRRIRITSAFGNMVVFVTDGHLPFPYGRETTGYEVADLAATLSKAQPLGVTILVEPYTSGDRTAAMVQFPGGYIAEIHALNPAR